MPLYEFYCRKCRKAFSASMSIAAHDRGVAACPKCGKKKDVEKRISTFTAVTSRKSAGM